MGKSINILHLSDLHYSHRSAVAHDQAIIINAFKEHLRRICDGFLRPDLIVFTGDLVDAADEEDVYLYLFDNLFEELAKITGCGLRRFILCPGNHDAHRSVIERERHTQYGLSSKIKDRDSLNSAYTEGAFKNFSANKFEKFNGFLPYLGTNTYSDGQFTSVFQPEGLDLDVVVLNSAVMAWADIEHQKDLRTLFIPEAAIQNGIDKLDSSGTRRRLVLTHHPLAWLTEFAEEDARAILERNFDLHLFGHMHDPVPEESMGLNGRWFRHQAGALQHGRKRYNGYGIVRLEAEGGNVCVHLNSYFDTRREFDLGIDRTPSGVFYPDETSKRFWEHQAKTDWKALRSWISAVLKPAATVCWNSGMSDRPVSEVFVAPPLCTRSVDVQEESVGTFEESPIVLGDMVRSGSNYILHGQSEYGKSTLLRQYALRLLDRGLEEKDGVFPTAPSVPIIIDFSDIRPGDGRFEKLLYNNLPAELEGGTKLKNLLDEGLITVIIDDVVFEDTIRQLALKQFISKYPKNRFIFSTLSDARHGFAGMSEGVVVDAGLSVSFCHVYIKALTRKSMRMLVEKWDPQGKTDKETLLNNMAKAFSGMNIPVTAANGTILLLIYNVTGGGVASRDEAPTNRSALIEHFVEYLLAKASLEDTKRKSFDFLNKEGVLANLAGSMARNDKYVVEYGEAKDAVNQYLMDIGLKQDADRLLEYFINVRILEHKAGDRISFRYRAFLEYFIACEMRIDSKFKEWILEVERYLSFINEIQYYAGMSRRDEALLELIGTRFSGLCEKNREQLAGLTDLSRIDTFVVPTLDTTNDLTDEFERQMNSPPLTSEERDEVLEGELPHDAENRQEVYRPKIVDDGPAWAMTLMLYSGVLRNLEMISDQKKREHLAKVLNGWGLLTMQSLWLVPSLAKHRQLRINGINYEVVMPRHFTEAQVARLIYFQLPNSLGKMLTWAFGTEKLERQLTEYIEETPEPLIISFYRYYLVSELHIGSWWCALEKLRSVLKSSSYLSEVLLRKVAETYFMGAYGENDTQKKQIGNELKQIAGNIEASRGFGDRGQAKGRAIQKIERKALVQRLKVMAQEAKASGE